MPTKPSKLPRWASTDVVDGTSGQNNVAEPSEPKKDLGWDFPEKPNRQWFNWLFRTIYQWTDWLNGTTIPLTLDGTTTNEQKADGTGHTHEITGLQPAAISGFLAAKFQYVDENGDSQGGNLYDIDANVTAGVWESFGPTGSGADNEWSALDVMPTDAKFVDVVIDSSLSPGINSATLIAYGKSAGAVVGSLNDFILGRHGITNTTEVLTNYRASIFARIPLVGRSFDFQFSVVGAPTVDMKLVGFGV